MSFSARYRPSFAADREQLDPAICEVVDSAVQALVDHHAGDPWNHDGVRLIEDDRFHTDQLIWRLKVVDGPADHRVFFTLNESTEELVFLRVKHRDDAYEQ